MSARQRSVHARLLGDDIQRLPPAVAALHESEGAVVWRGRVDVERGGGVLGRIVGAMLSLPPAGPDQEIEFRRTPLGEAERWERIISGRTFASCLAAHDSVLVERLGPAAFRFLLVVDEQMLLWRYQGARILGLPWPKALTPHIRAEECEHDGRYRFNVSVALPLLGRLVTYCGWLAPAD